ncbi:type II toxin-antitoxin system Phd/YefM family antitoxin [soil metagenome]
MQTVSVAEAKAHLSEILNQVVAGEEVVVTRRGIAIARIEAIKKPLQPLPPMDKFRAHFPAMDISSTEALRQLRDEGY